jgi:hypothetical protein
MMTTSIEDAKIYPEDQEKSTSSNKALQRSSEDGSGSESKLLYLQGWRLHLTTLGYVMFSITTKSVRELTACKSMPESFYGEH